MATERRTEMENGFMMPYLQMRKHGGIATEDVAAHWRRSEGKDGVLMMSVRHRGYGCSIIS